MQDTIQSALNTTIDQLSFPANLPHSRGKVRESFLLPNKTRMLVVTDRISAFDFVLGTIPFKGQILNQISIWWFEQLRNIVPHHFISSPDPNVSIVKNARPLPIEIIVRGYLTGTTKTSSWHAYQNLDRNICGIKMPKGMVKNQKFDQPIITPTTKPEEGHDEPISREEILAQGLVSADVYAKVEEYALKMFAFGQKVAAQNNLILVDTKYEMGIDEDGNLIVIDEVHTPDSSRYWIADSYDKRMEMRQEPDILDKEFVRRMLIQKGYDINDTQSNPRKYLSEDLKIRATERYIDLFQRMTGEPFQFPENLDAKGRIETMLRGFLPLPNL
jgi:phosphoribosylaminoimidazole-succinocarboxamide synthase